MDERWNSLGVTDTDLLNVAEWIQQERSLHHSCLTFFRLAGKLVSASINEYEFASVAFFHTVIGLERSVRMHYSLELHHPVEDVPFAHLIQKAVDESVITDSIFSEQLPSLEFFGFKDFHQQETQCRKLAVLIPQLRNAYMHGQYIMFSESVQLAVRLRLIADCLNTRKL